MEELLRAEGFDPEEWQVFGIQIIDSLEKRGKKSKRNRKKGKTETPMNTVHQEFQCDHCMNGKEIEGIRYSCQVSKQVRFKESECEDYDLCAQCFEHVKEFHPHRRFIAYEPPQKDVFGMWKQDEGKEVIVEDETPKEEVPKNDISTEDTPKEDASKEDISKDKASKDNNSQTVETKTISPSVSPQNETSSITQSTEDDRSWHVVKGKRKKGRSNSSTEHEEKKRLSNPSKLNYKKVIQKSLQNKTTIPTGTP